MLEKQPEKDTLDRQEKDTSSLKYILSKAKEKGVDISFEDIRQIQNQTQEIRAKYFGTNEWLKAPNGKETKLTEGQWLAVRTSNFKVWFGDWENNPKEASKTIDEDTKEPKVYFHGGARDVDDFKSLADREGDEYSNHGIYFSPNQETSSNFAVLKSGRVKNGAAVLYPVFLNIRNPKVIENSRYFDKQKRDDLVRNGFDGAIEVGGERAGYRQDDILVVFDGNQIKSAVGNIGTFSKLSKDTVL